MNLDSQPRCDRSDTDKSIPTVENLTLKETDIVPYRNNITRLQESNSYGNIFSMYLNHNKEINNLFSLKGDRQTNFYIVSPYERNLIRFGKTHFEF